MCCGILFFYVGAENAANCISIHHFCGHDFNIGGSLFNGCMYSGVSSERQENISIYMQIEKE